MIPETFIGNPYRISTVPFKSLDLSKPADSGIINFTMEPDLETDDWGNVSFRNSPGLDLPTYSISSNLKEASIILGQHDGDLALRWCLDSIVFACESLPRIQKHANRSSQLTSSETLLSSWEVNLAGLKLSTDHFNLGELNSLIQDITENYACLIEAARLADGKLAQELSSKFRAHAEEVLTAIKNQTTENRATSESAGPVTPL